MPLSPSTRTLGARLPKVCCNPPADPLAPANSELPAPPAATPRSSGHTHGRRTFGTTLILPEHAHIPMTEGLLETRKCGLEEDFT